MEKLPVKYIQVKEGKVYASASKEPSMDGVITATQVKTLYDLFYETFVEVSNYDVAVDWFMKHSPNDTWSDRGGNTIKDGFYPVTGMFMEVKYGRNCSCAADGYKAELEITGGCHVRNDCPLVCTISLEPVVGESQRTKDLN